MRQIEHKESYLLEFREESNSLGGETFRNSYSGSYSIQDSGKIDITIKVYSDAECSEFCRNYPWKLENEVDRYQVNDGQLKLGFGEQGVILYRKE